MTTAVSSSFAPDTPSLIRESFVRYSQYHECLQVAAFPSSIPSIVTGGQDDISYGCLRFDRPSSDINV